MSILVSTQRSTEFRVYRATVRGPPRRAHDLSANFQYQTNVHGDRTSRHPNVILHKIHVEYSTCISSVWQGGICQTTSVGRPSWRRQRVFFWLSGSRHSLLVHDLPAREEEREWGTIYDAVPTGRLCIYLFPTMPYRVEYVPTVCRSLITTKVAVLRITCVMLNLSAINR